MGTAAPRVPVWKRSDDRNFAVRSNTYSLLGGVVYRSGGAGIKGLGVIADTWAFPCS